MINLLESIDFYLEKGYEDAYATSKVAQDIILSKIFKNANFLENVQNSRYNWLGEETDIVLDTILDFVKQLEPLVV